MKLQIIGNPAEKIFDILKANGEINSLKSHSGTVNVLLKDDISHDLLIKIKNSIIYSLSGNVKNYIMKVVH